MSAPDLMQAFAGAEQAPPQHMRALDGANRVRIARADLKRRVGAGKLSVTEVILAVPSEAETMTVFDLLLAQRQWGATRCRKFLNSIPLRENKPVGELTERQRLAFVDRFSAVGKAKRQLVLVGEPPAVHL